MFDLGWTELLLIGIVALIVVGPKDLPGMFRTVGNFVGKAKRMAREFSQAMNDAADDAGMSDIQKTLKTATNPMSSAMNEVKKSTESFTKKTMESGKPKLDPERAEAAEKIRAKSAEMAQERLDREAAEKSAAAETAADAKAASAKAPAKKPAAKPAAKKPAAKKPTARKPAAKKPAAKKTPAAKSQTASKTTTRKTAAGPAAKSGAAEDKS